MVAGFCGGVSYVFVARKITPMQAVGSIIVGTFTANYLGELVAKMTTLGPSAAGYVTGLAAMGICQGVLEAVDQWRKGRKMEGKG